MTNLQPDAMVSPVLFGNSGTADGIWSYYIDSGLVYPFQRSSQIDTYNCICPHETGLISKKINLKHHNENTMALGTKVGTN